MKVILIKDYKKYKANEIIEAKDGFAQNFLIKNGYAQPVNSATLSNRENILKHIETNEAKKIELAQNLKTEIEKVELVFELKVHNDIVHGSITSKAIEKELKKFNIKLPDHSLTSVSINTIGIHGVPVSLHPKVKAFIKVRINQAK